MKEPSLDTIKDLEYGIRKATALKAALELNIFTLISRGHHTVKDIAAAAHSSERGIRILLDALCSLDLLQKLQNLYELTPSSRAFLVEGTPSYYGDWSLHAEYAWETRGRIAEQIKTGKAAKDASQTDFEELWASYCAPYLVIWDQMAEKARKMWEVLNIPKRVRILDAACGPGVKTFVVAQDDPDTRIVVIDFRKVLKIASRIAAAMKIKEQITFREGSLLDTDFGNEEFDIVFFGAVLHFFSPEKVKTILEKAYKTLKPNGLLVINTPMADEERSHSEALVLALQIFLFVPEGEVYTFSEYKTFLEARGFTSVLRHADSLLSARKPTL